MSNEALTVLKRVYLNLEKHHNTGNVKINGLIESRLPDRLEICHYKNVSDAFYLLRLESEEKTDDSIADTWHPSIESAIEQAEYEFNVHPNDWEN